MLDHRFLRVVAPVLLFCPLAAQEVSADLLSGLRARSIGPAGMSGRVTAVHGVPQQPNTIYVGAATGGLWKSTDGGLSFAPIFDDQPCASIGAIAVHPRRPDVVWIGTGEGNPRNSVSVGRGVFRSDDGGRSWRHLGLENTERIRRIRVHPDDPDVAFVAALGTTWGENEQRGVFKTVDGGRTWEKVLYVDKKTGCANLVMDPRNPDKLFANMWEHRRWPWFFRSGGPGSGLYRTLDGGSTWQQLGEAEGLPAGDLGRIGLAIAASNPDRVYALVEAKKSALLRSEDGGRRFRVVNDDDGIAPRPFYYADIRVDPHDEDRLINIHTTVTVSEDGGESFETLIPYNEIHPDHHAMWIHPDDPSFIIDGNDGGVAISRDRGATWRYVTNLPLGQYYHIDVDMDLPYNVYGGMQDNGSWRGPSAVWENGGIRNHHWHEVCFGDGFQTLPHPEEFDVGYAMSQQGNLVRYDVRTGARKDIKPADPDGVELRFNWNAGIAQDPFDADTIYFGSQHVHVSRDRGDHWETISEDLTTDYAGWQKQAESGGLTFDVTGAENYTTILAIAPSAAKKGVLWVGTDDGRLHVTKDGGQHWTSVEQRVPDVPRNTWIPHIEASRHDAGTAFVVFDDHRRANWTPYVFRTDDYGETWTSIATDAIDGYCLVIEQDPVNPDLLFLGTEFGLYFTIDAGAHWNRFEGGFPTVSAMDMVVHPRDGDLVVGTHGRSAWVIDDIRPLRGLAEAMEQALVVFEAPPVYQYTVKQTAPPRFTGATEFRGDNRPRGAMVSFWAKEASEKALEVEVLDAAGEVIKEIERVRAKAGVNRFQWRLDRDAPRDEADEEDEEDDSERGGRRGRGRGFRGSLPVLPGTYTVRVRMGEHESSTEVEVRADPRVEIDESARRAKYAAMQQAQAVMQRFEAVNKRLRAIRDRVETVRGHIKGLRKAERDEGVKALQEAADAVIEAFDALDKRISGDREGQGITRGDSLSRHLFRPLGSLRSSWDAPTGAQQRHLERAEEVMAELTEEVNALLTGVVEKYNDALKSARLSFAAETEPLK